MADLGGTRRTLNRAGYYYVALNYSLLFITLFSVFCFFSLAIEVIRIGNALDGHEAVELKVLRQKLEAFTTAYLIAKLLAAAYMLNAYIWKYSPLGKTSNLILAGLALTVIGVFFISIPRLYVD